MKPIQALLGIPLGNPWGVALALAGVAALAAAPALAAATGGADLDWAMMTTELFGGLALFLFGMMQMEEGLKAVAGEPNPIPANTLGMASVEKQKRTDSPARLMTKTMLPAVMRADWADLRSDQPGHHEGVRVW